VAGEFIERTYGKEVTDAMRKLKHAADPDNLLNPGKLFDAPPMDTHLRFGESYQVRTWNPSLHFEHERGLTGAIEHCNGQGVCRKTTGVMCPSYQATREEQNSTRGRANLLRALIANKYLTERSEPAGERSRSVGNKAVSVSGQRRFDYGTDDQRGSASILEATYQALDLCLACKGCKAECPSGVDMAKLKYEFENEYYKSHRRQLRDYVFGYFDVAAKLASSVAPLTNTFMSVPIFQRTVAKIMGITDKRPFPKFTTHRSHLQRDNSPNKQTVIYLSDPFGRYIEPDVEQAALDVLAACGYKVKLLPVVGAGASLLSKGFVDAAKRHAGKVLAALDQLDPTCEAAIVGIEPPDIYCLKNDYYDLLPDRREEIASRAAHAWFLDEFLLRSDGFSSLRVDRKVNEDGVAKTSSHVDDEIASLFARNDRVLFQPHCHQRAEGLVDDGLPSGTSATVEVLKLCGYEVEVLDTGCCGMAGTFGYEAEHYELSMQVGELKLFPLLRQSSIGQQKSEIVTGSGAACRMQMQQGAGVNAIHPIVLVREALL
jgi:Fe-S oxidoreductase